MRSHRVRRAVFAVTAVLTACGLAAAQSAATLDGTIGSATASSVTVNTEMGSTTVMVSDGTRVLRNLPASLAEIKPGTFLAITASKAPDGTLTAALVNIIDALPSARKGQWPMESGNIMTNMNVTSIVAGKSGRTLRLRYQEQTTSVIVPDGTRIRRIALAKLSDLKAGEHVIVRGARDAYGVITASSISIQ